jgi:hypothetical protein
MAGSSSSSSNSSEAEMKEAGKKQGQHVHYL